MVTLRNCARGISYAAKHAVYVAAIGALTAGVIGISAISLTFDTPKNIYEASIQDKDKKNLGKDLVVRLESGRNEIMLREKVYDMHFNQAGDVFVNLKTLKQEELDGVRQKYDELKQSAIDDYNSLLARLAEPEN